MPLTINLLHEEQYLLQQRKRDPLKLGLYALAGVAALFVMYYGWRLISSTALNQEVKAREAEWAKQEPASNAAAAQEKEVSAKIAASDVISHRIEGRSYWAPLLGTILKAVPPNVQLVNFGGDNETGADHMRISIEGVVAGDVPRLTADQFRTALNDSLNKHYQGVSSSFRSLDAAPTPVVLNGKSSPTARFTIDIQLNKPGAAATPTPAPERRKHS